MARRRKTRRTRRAPRRRSSITRRRGMGQLFSERSAASAYVPPLLGGGLAALTVIGIRQFLTPVPGKMSATIFKQAPLVSILVGGVAGSLIARQLTTRSDATKATAGAVTGAGLVGLSHVITEAMRRNDVARATAGDPAAAANVAAETASGNGNGNGTSGLGAIVPQYGSLPAGNGMGAIVMEQLSGNRQDQGAVVNLRGTGLNGMVETNAFGTAPYGA